MTYTTKEGAGLSDLRPHRRAARRAAAQKMIDGQAAAHAAANAAIFSREDAERERLLNEQLDAVGVPRDAHNAAAWYQRAADRSRLEAAQRDVARMDELAAEIEHDKIADQLAQTERDRALVAALTTALDETEALLSRAEQREDVKTVAAGMRHAGARLDQTLRDRLPSIRWRVATGGTVTVGEIELLKKFDGGAERSHAELLADRPLGFAS